MLRRTESAPQHQKGFKYARLELSVLVGRSLPLFIFRIKTTVTLCLVDFNNGDVLIRNGDLFDDDILHLRHFVGE